MAKNIKTTVLNSESQSGLYFVYKLYTKKHKLFATKFNSKKWSASDLPLLLDILDHKIIKEFDTMKIRDKGKESISQSQVLYY